MGAFTARVGRLPDLNIWSAFDKMVNNIEQATAERSYRKYPEIGAELEVLIHDSKD